MTSVATPQATLTEFRLTMGGLERVIRCRRVLLSMLDEQRYLGDDESRQYGLVLWPSSIALALEIAERATQFRGARVIELGAGVGLPGIIAASLGARVLQTDRDPEALDLCGRNAALNGVATDVRPGDWTEWTEPRSFDWTIASDVLYRVTLHDQLRAVLERCVGTTGRVLVADPMRAPSLKLLEGMERDGWRVRLSRWRIGEGDDARAIGVYELAPPSAGGT